MNQKRTKKELTEANDQFLQGVASKTRGLADHIDTQTNILIGVSFAVFLFSLSKITEEGIQSSFLVTGLFSGISAFICLLGVHPPKIMRKRGQKESLLYNKYIANLSSAKDYAKKLNEVLDDREKIISHYATEIYNLSKYYYRPKRKLFNLSRNILILGIVLSFIVFFIKIIL